MATKGIFKSGLGLVFLLIVSSGFFVLLLLDVIDKAPPKMQAVSVEEVEAGRRPSENGAERWRVSGGMWRVDDAVVTSERRSIASYRKGQMFYVARVPYSSSLGIPLSEVRIESRFELGTSPEIDPDSLGEPTGTVYFATPELPKAGPRIPGLHPRALAVVDYDAGKLPAYWFLLLPLVVMVDAAWRLVARFRNAESSVKRAKIAKGHSSGFRSCIRTSR